MSRPSYFGGLMLVGLGVLLLAANFDPEFSLWELFADQWPWLLVAAGGFRLIELAVARLSGGVPPTPLTWAALVPALALCWAGSAAHLVHHADYGGWARWIETTGWWRSDHEFPLEQSQRIADSRTLVIRGVRGTIDLLGVDVDAEPELRLSGVRIVAARSLESAREIYAESQLRVRPEGERLVLESTPAGDHNGQVRYRLEIRAPRNLAVVMEKASGSASIRNFEPALRFEGTGSLTLEDLAGAAAVQLRGGRELKAGNLAAGLELEGSVRRLNLNAIQGNVRLQGDSLGRVDLAQLDGPLELVSKSVSLAAQAISGKASVRDGLLTLEGARGPIRIQSKRGGVRLERFDGETSVSVERGRIEAKAPDGLSEPFEARTERGDIRLELPAGAAVSLTARAQNGTIRNRLSSDPDLHRPKKPYRWSSGGGPRVELESGRGDIQITPLRRREPVEM